MVEITDFPFYKDVIVKVERVRKTFRGKCVLNTPSITIREGEMVALIGPSGSGKSTLLRHLSGLTRSDGNSKSKVMVCGNNIQSEGRLDRKVRRNRRHIGFIFQQFNLLNRMTTLDNVLVGALSSTPFWRTYIKFFSKEQRQRAIEALDSVGMSEYAY